MPSYMERYALVSQIVYSIAVAMSEQEVHVSVAQHIIIKFLVYENVKPTEVLCRLCPTFDT